MTTPNNAFTHLKDWMDQTLTWLHPDGSANILQKSHAQLLEMMREAKKENQANRVWDLIYKLERLANRTTDTQQKGEIFIHCAKMAADLENLKDALYFFQAADTHYLSYKHQHAIVMWMTGCIHWVLEDNVEGISAWQAAISLFQQRQSNAHLDSDEGKWYTEKLKRMEDALAMAIGTGKLPPWDFEAFREGTSQDSSQPHAEASIFEGDTLCWVSCEVRESVPAGGFGAVGFDPEPLGSLEISEVVIEGQRYEVFNVRRASSRHNSADVHSQTHYQAVRVTGTSMNAAKPIPILNGDYVLIAEQSDAEDNEIVVAGIIGQDERATVKRLRRRNGKYRLIPETTDPKHSEIDWEKEFTPLDAGFKIIGTVVAIFKKKTG